MPMRVWYRLDMGWVLLRKRKKFKFWTTPLHGTENFLRRSIDSTLKSRILRFPVDIVVDSYAFNCVQCIYTRTYLIKET